MKKASSELLPLSASAQSGQSPRLFSCCLKPPIIRVRRKTEQRSTACFHALLASSRDTDVVGWYKDGNTVGAMFTGLVVDDKNSILNTILTRVSSTLREELTFDQFNQVSISLHFFPDDWDHDDSGPSQQSGSLS